MKGNASKERMDYMNKEEGEKNLTKVNTKLYLTDYLETNTPLSKQGLLDKQNHHQVSKPTKILKSNKNPQIQKLM